MIIGSGGCGVFADRRMLVILEIVREAGWG
jgi:hypothetical protein